MILTDSQKRFIHNRRKKLPRLKLLESFNKKFKLNISIKQLNLFLTKNQDIGEAINQKEVKGVIHIKTGKEKLRGLHRIIYEQHHGKLKDEDIIIFMDGDKRNFNIENLVKINFSQMRAITRRIGKRTDELVMPEKLIAIIEFHDKVQGSHG